MAGPGRALAERPAAVQEAMVSRGNAIGANRVEQRANQIAQTVREQGWRPGAQEATARPVKDYRSKLDMMGTERNPATGEKLRRPGTPERRRYDEGNNAANMAHEFAQKGYDGITDAGLRRRLEDAVIAEALTRTDIGDRIRRMSSGEQRLYAQDLLRDPRMVGHARRLYDAVMAGEIKFTETEKEQEELDIARIETQDKEAELREASDKLRAVKDRLRAFDRGGGVARGAKAVRLEELRREMPNYNIQITNAENDLRDAESRIKRLDDERRNASAGRGARTTDEIDRDIEAANVTVRAARTNIETAKSNIAEKDALEKEEQELNQKEVELEKERREKDTAHKKAQTAEQRRRNLLQQAKDLRTSEEEDLVNGFKGIVGEASNECLNEDAKLLDAAYDQSAKELAAQTGDQNAKALMDALQNAYLGNERVRMRGVIGFRRRESYRPISREAVNRHYDLLMNRDLPNGTIDGGPGEVMTQLLMTRINPDTNRNYTDPEARAIVANKEFRDKYQGEVVKQLLGRRMLSGGIAPEDHHLITNAKWGQGMIDQAIASNQEFRQNVEKTFGAGALSQPGFAEKFGQEARRNPFWFLLLLGIPGLLAGVRGGIGGHSISG